MGGVLTLCGAPTQTLLLPLPPLVGLARRGDGECPRRSPARAVTAPSMTRTRAIVRGSAALHIVATIRVLICCFLREFCKSQPRDSNATTASTSKVLCSGAPGVIRDSGCENLTAHPGQSAPAQPEASGSTVPWIPSWRLKCQPLRAQYVCQRAGSPL